MPRSFLIFLGAFFPIVVACVSGVSNVPSIFRRAGRNFGLSPAQILARVVFPAALPQILIGLRIALGIAWLVVVAGGDDRRRFRSWLSGHRFAQFRQALRPGRRGHADDRRHRTWRSTLLFRSLEKIRSVRWGFRHES